MKKTYGSRKLTRTGGQVRELLIELHGTWEANGCGGICAHQMNAKWSNRTSGIFVSCNSVTGEVTNISRMLNQENPNVAFADRFNKAVPPFIMNYDAICLGNRAYRDAKEDIVLRNGIGTFKTETGANGELDCPDLKNLNRLVAPNPPFSFERHIIRQFARSFISTGDPYVSPKYKLDCSALPMTYCRIMTCRPQDTPDTPVCKLQEQTCDVPTVFKPECRESMLTARHLVSARQHL